jgi:HPr Serine kinase C-terminal domain
LRGIVCLHGSAISIQDQAVLLLGDSGAGKSTTAAALSQRGFAVLSDDLVPLQEYHGQFWVQPTYPQVRLWSDTVTALYGAPNQLPQLTDSWEKRCLDLRHTSYQFQSHPLPLGAVYLLRERSTDTAIPKIGAVERTQGLLDLIFNRYTSNLPDKLMQAHCFEVLSQVVRQVPIRQITPSNSLDTLPQLCDLLVADFQTCG